MMRVTKPAEEIEVCDFCGRDTFLQTCLVLKNRKRYRYCLTCDGKIAGCWVQPNICRECQDREDVKSVVSEYAKQITPIIRKRDEELKRLEQVPERNTLEGI